MRQGIMAGVTVVLLAGVAGAARAAPLCGAGLRRNCQAARSTRLVVGNSTDHAKDSLSWDWLQGAATTLEQLGVPTGSTEYAPCIYAGTSTAAIAEAAILISRSGEGGWS